MRLLDLLGDSSTREILTASSQEPHSVKELSEACGLPLSSTYQKVGRLVDGDLLIPDLTLDADGNHHHVYETDFQAALVFLEENTLEIDICQPTDEVDRLLWVWNRIRKNSSGRNSNGEGQE